MEPASTIIKTLGGHRAVADYCGTAVNAPYRWTYEKTRGGTGGVIPHRYHDTLLEMARELGVSITRAQLVLKPEEMEQGSAA